MRSGDGRLPVLGEVLPDGMGVQCFDRSVRRTAAADQRRRHLAVLQGDAGAVRTNLGWTEIYFDGDASWLSGPSGFGFGADCSAQHGTVLSDMQYLAGPPVVPGYVSVYMRRLFRVMDPLLANTLTLTVDYDDAFVAYLNGTEVARRNVVGTPPRYSQVATGDHECSVCNSTCNAAENIDMSGYKNLLVSGTNVLAIHAHNLTLASSDFTITPSMTATWSGCTSNGQCDDGLWCNGAETCNLGTSTCVGRDGAGLCDAVACTTDWCDEATDGAATWPTTRRAATGARATGPRRATWRAGASPGPR